MKKILFIVNSLGYGGIQSTFVTLIKHLSKHQSIELTVRLLSNKGVYFSQLPPNIKIIDSEIGESNRLRPFRETVSNSLKKFEIKSILQLATDSFFAFLYSPRDLSFGDKIRYRITNNMRNMEPYYDIAVAYSDASPLFYLSRKVKAKRKYVWIHSDYAKIKRDPTSLSLYYSLVDNIICVSEDVKKSFIEKCKREKDKTIVINNMLDYEKINEMSSVEFNLFDKSKINIVSVGRLTEEKNYTLLLDIFIELRSKYENICLYIIGDGVLKESLQKSIKGKLYEDSIVFTGFQENPYKYIKNSTIYVQTSLYEGFSTTINEARYLQVPIVTTKVAGVCEILEDGITGLIVECKREKIKKAIENLIIDEKLRKKLIDNLREKTEINIQEKYLEKLFLY